MAEPDDYALTRIAERIDQLNRELSEIRDVATSQQATAGPNAELHAALGAINTTLKVHTHAVNVLLELVGTLAAEIDRLRRQS